MTLPARFDPEYPNDTSMIFGLTYRMATFMVRPGLYRSVVYIGEQPDERFTRVADTFAEANKAAHKAVYKGIIEGEFPEVLTNNPLAASYHRLWLKEPRVEPRSDDDEGDHG
jgi:hypothetical protein